MDRRKFIAGGIVTVTTVVMPSTTTAQATPTPNEANPFLFGNAFEVIPEGEADTVQVVLIGEPNEDRLPFVIRNSTESAIGVDEVTGVARDSSGSLADVVDDSTIVPHVIEAGGIAIGFARFSSGGDRIVGADFELQVDFGEPNRYLRNLSIVEAAVQNDGIIGLAENTSQDTVDWPRIGAVVFSDDGEIEDYCFASASRDEVQPGSTAPFILDCFGDQVTGLYLIGAVGSSF
jgi:hypothetical protein